jgi:hypothetical protein
MNLRGEVKSPSEEKITASVIREVKSPSQTNTKTQVPRVNIIPSSDQSSISSKNSYTYKK